MIEIDRVWEQLRSRLHAFVRRRVRNDADADDVVQRVFLQIHRGMGSLRDERRLHAWIYRTARNTIIDHYRAAGRLREAFVGSALDLPDVGTDENSAGEQAALRELSDCLQPLMAQLSSVDQQALQVVELEGLSQVDAARRLGLSISGMKSRVQRARHRLKVAVEACCRVQLDRRGQIMSYEKQAPASCDRCDDASCATP